MTSIPQVGVSAELLAANQRLLAQRSAVQRHAQCPGKRLAGSSSPPTVSAWGLSLTPVPQPKPQTDPSGHIRHYPDIGLAWLRNQLASTGRVWLLARYLDRDGRGWLDVDTLRHHLTTKESPLRICGWRRLRTLLNKGEGVFWRRDSSKRMWLFSAEKHATHLNITKLTGKPILLPITQLVDGMQAVRANLFAAFHSGRRSDSPISRETLKTISGVAERTQRIYDEVVGIKKQSNIAVGGGPVSAENTKSQLADRGAAAFILEDKKGRLGRIGRKYIAWRLPNQYAPPHQSAARGRQRKINQQLNGQTDLVDLRAQGNGSAECQRLFYANTKPQINAHSDSYWFDAQAKVWHAVTPPNPNTPVGTRQAGQFSPNHRYDQIPPVSSCTQTIGNETTTNVGTRQAGQLLPNNRRNQTPPASSGLHPIKDEAAAGGNVADITGGRAAAAASLRD